jgi:hypothetical protein
MCDSELHLGKRTRNSGRREEQQIGSASGYHQDGCDCCSDAQGVSAGVPPVFLRNVPRRKRTDRQRLTCSLKSPLHNLRRRFNLGELPQKAGIIERGAIFHGYSP